MRTKILKTAFNLMGKKTVKDVSMQEIATACNITKPSLYYYFKSKDEICYTIIRFVLDDLEQESKKSPPSPPRGSILDSIFTIASIFIFNFQLI